MTLFHFRFRDGLRRFWRSCFPEVPLGTSGPTQAPSTYVADRGVCILECMCYSPSPNSPLTRFFFDTPLGETSATDEFSPWSDSSYLSSLCGARLVFRLLSWALDPLKPVWKGPKRTFYSCQMVISLIQPRPSMTDVLGGQYFSLAATDRFLSSRRGM